MAFKLNGDTCETFVSPKPGAPSQQVEHLSNGTVRLAPTPVSSTGTPVPGISVDPKGIVHIKPTTAPPTDGTHTQPNGGGPSTSASTSVSPSPSDSTDDGGDDGTIVDPVPSHSTSTEVTTPPTTAPTTTATTPPPLDCDPVFDQCPTT
jgi:serine/threonine-protein kinase